jgi:uncharacterized repeat protein (TIGR03803 family)
VQSKVATRVLSRLAGSFGSAAFAWLLASSLGAQTYQVLHSFTGPDGVFPHAALIADAAGNLYGTTAGSGLNHGTVFKLDAANGYALTTLHSFSGDDGSNPWAAVIADASGNLYGTTCGGGSSGFGTVFRLDAANNYALTTLHSFSGPDGDHPAAAVIVDASGDLYGTTYGNYGGGPPYYYGTVFKLDAANGYALTTLHSFSGPDGAYPAAAVITDAAGNLYGTTVGGGPYDHGTIFKLDAANGYALTTLHSFNLDGMYPKAAVMADAAGNLYGTTFGRWDSGIYGTVFKLDVANNYSRTTLHGFSGSDGAYPAAAVVADAAGNLYGTTYGEYDAVWGWIYDYGSIFKLDAANNYALTVLHSFSGDDGSQPWAEVIADDSGTLFGTTEYGGTGSKGIVFSLSTGVPAPVMSIAPTSGPSEGDTEVTITGSGFSGAASVRIGGALATGVTVVSSTQITALTPPLPPGRLNDVEVTNATLAPSVPSVLPGGFFSDFLDVPQADIFHADVEKVFRNGITAGCGGGDYCRNSPVTRAQMAVFLLKGEHGSAYLPPACAGTFGDVPCPGQYATWIEQLSAEGITAGCGAGNYCPGDSVTRAQMAAFLLKAEHGSSYVPPACAGTFGDVPCPSQYADWIEQLSAEGITGGCGAGDYCPGNPASRGQMAVFLVKTFGLP